MFWKSANSDTENGLKKSKMFPEKIYIQRQLKTGKDTFWEAPEQHGQRGGLHHYIVFFFISKRPAS